MYESQLSAAHIRNAVANTLFTFASCSASHIFGMSYANNSPCMQWWKNMNPVPELKYPYSFYISTGYSLICIVNKPAMVS